jgi:hypothetical protein
VQELREELSTVTAAFEEVQEEKDVLKLKLMATQTGADVLRRDGKLSQ